MDKEKDKNQNIFETAAEKGRKFKKSKTHSPSKGEPFRTPVPDRDPNPQPRFNEGTANENVSETRSKDPEIKDMMGKIHLMRQDLERKMNQIYNISGLDTDSFKEFLNNPKNFGNKDWQFIQENKSVLEQKVWLTIGDELKPPTGGPALPGRENIAGERKGKTLGARKKWINMH